MSRLSDVEIFVGVVDARQFSAAARALDLSKSYVSKRVSELEDRLGVRLLNRTTRRVALTPAGSTYYERCVVALDGLNEAERALSEEQSALRGTLRLTAPLTFGLRYVAPIIADFTAAHPDLHVHADYSDRMVDLVAEGYDAGIRVGNTQDTTLDSRWLAPVKLFVVASETYLRAAGEPKTPHELENHECLLYSRDAHPRQWTFANPSGPITVPVAGRLRSDTGDALMEAAVRGVGIARLPDFICGDHLRSGEVRAILEPWTKLIDGSVRAVFPHRRFMPAKVTAVLAELAERFESAPWCEDLGVS